VCVGVCIVCVCALCVCHFCTNTGLYFPNSFTWHTACPLAHTKDIVPHEWHTDGVATTQVLARLCLYGAGAAHLGIGVPLTKDGKAVSYEDGNHPANQLSMRAPCNDEVEEDNGEQRQQQQQQHTSVFAQMMTPALAGLCTFFLLFVRSFARLTTTASNNYFWLPSKKCTRTTL